jgi:hypothetical protein
MWRPSDICHPSTLWRTQDSAQKAPAHGLNKRDRQPDKSLKCIFSGEMSMLRIFLLALLTAIGRPRQLRGKATRLLLCGFHGTQPALLRLRLSVRSGIRNAPQQAVLAVALEIQRRRQVPPITTAKRPRAALPILRHLIAHCRQPASSHVTEHRAYVAEHVGLAEPRWYFLRLSVVFWIVNEHTLDRAGMQNLGLRVHLLTLQPPLSWGKTPQKF